MRYPILNDAKNLLSWAGRLVQQLEKDFAQPYVTDFTLTANAASSTLSHNAIRPTSSFSFEPITANAAAERGGTALYHATPTLGAVVVNHVNSAQTDRTFRVTIHNP